MTWRFAHKLLRQAGNQMELKTRMRVRTECDDIDMVFTHSMKDMLEEFAAF